MAPTLPLRPGHRRQNRTEVFIAGTAILARLPWLLKLNKAGDTTAIYLLRSWLQPQLLWHRVHVLLFGSFSCPRTGREGTPGDVAPIPTASLIPASQCKCFGRKSSILC